MSQVVATPLVMRIAEYPSANFSTGMWGAIGSVTVDLSLRINVTSHRGCP